MFSETVMTYAVSLIKIALLRYVGTSGYCTFPPLFMCWHCTDSTGTRPSCHALRETSIDGSAFYIMMSFPRWARSCHSFVKMYRVFFCFVLFALFIISLSLYLDVNIKGPAAKDVEAFCLVCLAEAGAGVRPPPVPTEPLPSRRGLPPPAEAQGAAGERELADCAVQYTLVPLHAFSACHTRWSAS